MENSLYIALSRQAGLRRELDVIAHNIANVDTPAFKAERVIFREYLSKPSYGEQYSFVDDVGNARDLQPGHMVTTNNDLDVALASQGYFVVETPLGERYTRHGRFQLNAEGELVNGKGYRVLGQDGPITINSNTSDVEITGDAAISVPVLGVLDTLRIVEFEDEATLRRGANSLYIAEPDAVITEVEQPRVVQGMLEGSNVTGILEITRMIQSSRTYEGVNQFVKREDERILKMIEKTGTPFG